MLIHPRIMAILKSFLLPNFLVTAFQAIKILPVVFLSTLWHGGGSNTANVPRLAVSAQYCEPWIRPQENQFLSIPPSLVPKLDPEIQTLIGYIPFHGWFTLIDLC